MKALFIGSVQFSAKLLNVIKKNSNIELVGLVTKQKSTFNSDFVDISLEFESSSRPDTFYFKNSNSEEMEKWIADKKPEVIFCLGWSHLLPQSVLNVPQLTVGYHPASLPANRGRHPIIWALCLGLPETSSTFFEITATADEGDILSQQKVTIKPDDYAADLYERLEDVAEVQLEKLLNDLVQGQLKPIKQDEQHSNYWRKRQKLDGKIDWRMSAKSIYNLIRALAPPYPGAYFTHNEIEFTVLKSQILSGKDFENRIPGEIINILDGKPVIKTGDDLVLLEKLNSNIDLNKGDFL